MTLDFLPEGETPNIRDTVLQHASLLTRERGLALLTLDSVARASGLRTTDVRRHFWHRHDLVVGVFKALLDRLQERLADAAARDPLAHGRAGRAYLTLVTAPGTSQDEIRQLTAFTGAMTHARSISVFWHAWLSAQFDGIADPIDPNTLELICLAIDGLRLQDATQGNKAGLRQTVLQRLTGMTHPPCESLEDAAA